LPGTHRNFEQNETSTIITAETDLAAMENPPRKYFSPMVIWALIVFALVMLAIILAGYGYRSYRHTEDAERDKLIRLADQASIQMAQEMDAIDSVLERAIAQVTEARRSRQAEDSDRFFSQLTASNTAISSLVAVDTDGVIFASSRASLKGNVFFNSERYKLISQHPDAKTLYVSTPFITPLGKRASRWEGCCPTTKEAFMATSLPFCHPRFSATPCTG